MASTLGLAPTSPIMQAIESDAGPTWGGLVTLLDQAATNACCAGNTLITAGDVFGQLIQQATFQAEGGVAGQVVLGDTDQPLAGALVTLATADGSQAVAGGTGLNGDFQIPQVAPGVYNVTVAGYLVTQTAQVTVPADGLLTGVSITVTPGGAISGTVTESGGEGPIGNMVVTALSNQGSSFTTQTADNGNYQFAGLPDGTYTITAGGGSFDSQTSQPVSIVDAQTVGGVNLALDPAASLQGTVESAASGTAVAQATVVAVDSNGVVYTSTTDTNGEYTIGNLHPGTYNVTVQAAGFAETTTTDTIVQAGSTTLAPILTLSAPASLTVTLQNSSSAPISSVGVDLIQNGAVMAAGETDSTGQTTLSGLAPGTDQLQTEAFPYLSPGVSVTVQAGASLDETYVLQVGGTVQGKVTDGSGNPLANVPVTILGQDGSSSLTTTTASDGTYQMQGLNLGTYAVMIGSLSGLERQEISFSASNPTATVNFALAGATLAGTVLEADGATPLTSATVYLMLNGAPGITGSTDANGDYSFEGVPPGTYTVQTDEAAGFASSQSVVVTTGTVTIPIIKEGSDTLSGTVDDASGDPISGATILVEPAILPALGLSLTATTAANGGFTIQGLAAGSYVVSVNAAGYAIQQQTSALSGSSGPLGFRLQTGTTLSGTVTDALSGAAVTDASITVVSESTHQVVATAQTGEEGTYQVPNLAAGTYDLIAADSSHGINELFGLTIGASPAVQNLALQAESAGLQGTVTDVQGNPIADAFISVLDSHGNLLISAQTNFFGGYTISGLPAGTVTVAVGAEGYAPTMRSGVALQSGQATAGINLALTPAGIDQSALYNLYSGYQKAMNGFTGWALSSVTPIISGLDPDPLGSPESLPSSSNLIGQVTADAANGTSCQAELTALTNLINAQQKVEKLWPQYQQDYQKLQDTLGNAINTFIVDMSNVLLGTSGKFGGLMGEVEYLDTIPKAGKVIGFAGEAEGVSGNALALEKFFTEIKPYVDDIAGVEKQWIDDTTGQNDVFNAYSRQNQLDAYLSLANQFITYISPVLDIAQNMSSTLKLIPGLNDLLGVLSTATDAIHNAIDVMNNYQKVEQDQQQYIADQNAYRAALLALAKAHADCNHPKPPPPTHPTPGPSAAVDSDPPEDPNDITGPAGFGAADFILTAEPLSYRIDFENTPTASAAAAVVSVTQQLSPNLDWSTFQLGSIGFGSQLITVPEGRMSYSTTIDLPAGTPGTGPNGLEVQIAAGINVQTGLVTWTLTSLDPTTQDIPIDPSVGFLPPDDASGDGEGYVSYTIQPKASAATGTVINAQASVVFDVNAPISTEAISNTIDTTVPTSSVTALPATTTSTSFTVSWSGSDGAGSGIALYNVFVSDDGGKYQPLVTNTTATSTTFTGQVGHTYSFYSVATSNLGLVQSTPTTAQATVTVEPKPVIVTSVHWGTIQVKVGTGKKAKTKTETALEIQFSGAVSGAGKLGAYQLSSVTTKKVKKTVVTTLKPIKLSSIVPGSTPTTTSVALVPAGTVKEAQTDRLQIIAADLTDAHGRALDGNDDGQPGGNFVGTFGKNGLTFAAPSAVLNPMQTNAAAVDAVLRHIRFHPRAR